MQIAKNNADGTPSDLNVPFGASAFVVADGADCHYEPDFESAVRVAPPYGTAVAIIRDEGDWVLIKFCGKEAWSPRRNLSTTLGPMRPAAEGEPNGHPSVRYTFNPQIAVVREWTPPVEYGPRGGRFVRTAKGFRRYF
jgi:hypothetical protein